MKKIHPFTTEDNKTIIRVDLYEISTYEPRKIGSVECTRIKMNNGETIVVKQLPCYIDKLFQQINMFYVLN